MANSFYINNSLLWDNSHLGVFNKVISDQRSIGMIKYFEITLPQGKIFCRMKRAKNLFPCILEEIKKAFDIPHQGIHRITIGKKEWLLYYVPISATGEVIIEDCLSKIENKNVLRKDQTFRGEVRKTIVFCEILSLSNTRESSIYLRQGVNNNYVPISINESLAKLNNATTHDFSILTKVLLTNWFEDEMTPSIIVKELIAAAILKINNSFYNKLCSENKMDKYVSEETDLSVNISRIRYKIDEIIKEYDNNFIWYSFFIINRIMRYGELEFEDF